jgi:hypothetical protein
LLVGVEVIFIPSDTPQANAVMESFNDLWDSNFWHRTKFANLLSVQSELAFFEHYCRHRRPLPEFDGQTADQVAPDFVPTCLPVNFDLHQQKRLPITAGKLHFIRFVSSTGTFSLLNEHWQVDKEHWAGKTVRAEIDTATEKLTVYHQEHLSPTCQQVAVFDYALSEPARPLASEFNRPRTVFWNPPG